MLKNIKRSKLLFDIDIEKINKLFYNNNNEKNIRNGKLKFVDI